MQVVSETRVRQGSREVVAGGGDAAGGDEHAVPAHIVDVVQAPAHAGG